MPPGTTTTTALPTIGNAAATTAVFYGSGRSRDWLKMKNADAPAVKREAEEDWEKERLDQSELHANGSDHRMSKKPQRLPPTPSVIKRLFAYSGNQCAMPNCTEQLVDVSGTMLGKIAHICAAEKGGARYDPEMTEEQRRDISNLFIVCGKHHDIIDDKNNEKMYPADLLRRYKTTHEGRFKKAERQLLKQFVDTTQIAQPTYPKHLRALAKALDVKELADHREEIRGVGHFIDSLKELPLAEREFALKLAERMRRRRKDSLPVEDVMGAFRLSASALNRHMGVLEDHQLGSIDELPASVDLERGLKLSFEALSEIAAMKTAALEFKELEDRAMSQAKESRLQRRIACAPGNRSR
jgi:hypothetical protein